LFVSCSNHFEVILSSLSVYKSNSEFDIFINLLSCSNTSDSEYILDLQSLDIFFEPKRSVSDVVSYLENTQKLRNQAINGNKTSLIDYTKSEYLSNVSDYEWSYSRLKKVCKFLDVEIIEENNPNENVITFIGKGEFMIYESLNRHFRKESNPRIHYSRINNKIKFQKEN